MVSSFQTDISAVQLTLSAFMFGFAGSQLAYGSLSDRFGRRRVVLGGLVIYLGASFGCLVAQTIEQLIVLRFLQAIGACSGAVIGRAVVRDLYSAEQGRRIFSYMSMSMALAPAIGPIIGGFLVTFGGWRACFLALFLIGGCVFTLVYAFLKESNRHPDPTALEVSRLVRTYAFLIRDREFIGYTLCASGIFCGMFTFISGSSFVLIGYFGLTPMMFGVSFSLFIFGYIAGTFVSGAYALRFGSKVLIIYGAIISSVSGGIGVGLILLGIEHVLTVMAPMSLFMFGAGLVLPNAQMGGIAAFPRMAGAASALLGFIQMSSAACVGIVVGLLTQNGPLPMMTILFAMSLFCLTAAWGILYREFPQFRTP